VKNPADLTLTQIARALRRRTFSSTELTQWMLERIARWQPVLNAFVRVEADEALAAAKAADRAIVRGSAIGPLHGVPLAHKDMYYVKGKVSECGSKVRKGFIAPATSTALARLAWHLGDRHVPVQLFPNRLRVRRDAAIEALLARLGAKTVAIEAPFDPEGGAYLASAHGHRHDHHHDQQPDPPVGNEVLPHADSIRFANRFVKPSY